MGQTPLRLPLPASALALTFALNLFAHRRGECHIGSACWIMILRVSFFRLGRHYRASVEKNTSVGPGRQPDPKESRKCRPKHRTLLTNMSAAGCGCAVLCWA